MSILIDADDDVGDVAPLARRRGRPQKANKNPEIQVIQESQESLTNALNDMGVEEEEDFSQPVAKVGRISRQGSGKKYFALIC
jgi:hypothetical protein